MKLRFFYRIDQKKDPIPFSNIRRKNKPKGLKWRELKNPCCSKEDVPCTCGPRFFVQLDNSGDPVDGTLIKRKLFPEPEEGIRFMEVRSSADECCLITISLTTNGAVTTSADDIYSSITSVTSPATLSGGTVTSRISTRVDMEITVVFKVGATGTYATDLSIPAGLTVDSYTWTAGAAGAGTYVIKAHATSKVSVVYDIVSPAV